MTSLNRPYFTPQHSRNGEGSYTNPLVNPADKSSPFYQISSRDKCNTEVQKCYASQQNLKGYDPLSNNFEHETSSKSCSESPILFSHVECQDQENQESKMQHPSYVNKSTYAWSTPLHPDDEDEGIELRKCSDFPISPKRSFKNITFPLTVDKENSSDDYLHKCHSKHSDHIRPKPYTKYGINCDDKNNGTTVQRRNDSRQKKLSNGCNDTSLLLSHNKKTFDSKYSLKKDCSECINIGVKAGPGVSTKSDLGRSASLSPKSELNTSRCGQKRLSLPLEQSTSSLRKRKCCHSPGVSIQRHFSTKNQDEYEHSQDAGESNCQESNNHSSSQEREISDISDSDNSGIKNESHDNDQKFEVLTDTSRLGRSVVDEANPGSIGKDAVTVKDVNCESASSKSNQAEKSSTRKKRKKRKKERAPSTLNSSFKCAEKDYIIKDSVLCQLATKIARNTCEHMNKHPTVQDCVDCFACLGQFCQYISESWIMTCSHMTICNRMKDCSPSVWESKMAESQSKAVILELFACLGQNCEFVCRGSFKNRGWSKVCSHMDTCLMVERPSPPMWRGKKESGNKAIEIILRRDSDEIAPLFARIQSSMLKTDVSSLEISTSSSKPAEGLYENIFDTSIRLAPNTIPIDIFACCGQDCKVLLRGWSTMCDHMVHCSMVEKRTPPVWKDKMPKSHTKAILIMSSRIYMNDCSHLSVKGGGSSNEHWMVNMILFKSGVISLDRSTFADVYTDLIKDYFACVGDSCKVFKRGWLGLCEHMADCKDTQDLFPNQFACLGAFCEVVKASWSSICNHMGDCEEIENSLSFADGKKSKVESLRKALVITKGMNSSGDKQQAPSPMKFSLILETK